MVSICLQILCYLFADARLLDLFINGRFVPHMHGTHISNGFVKTATCVYVHLMCFPTYLPCSFKPALGLFFKKSNKKKKQKSSSPKLNHRWANEEKTQ